MQFRKIASLVLCLILGWVYGTSAATYYMRADGTAPNKEAATGPPSDKSRCMNVATHNGQTFAPGDLILLSEQGGVFGADGSGKNSIMVPSSGNAGAQITYMNVAGETPVIENNEVIAGQFTEVSPNLWKLVYSSSYLDLFLDGVPLQRIYDSTTPAVGQWAFDDSRRTFYIGATSDPSGRVKAHNWYQKYNNGFDITNKDYITITSNITGTIKFVRCRRCIYADDFTPTTIDYNNIIINGLEFHYCWRGVDLNTYPAASRYIKGSLTNNKGYYCKCFLEVGGPSFATFIITGNYGYGIGSINGFTSWAERDDREYLGMQNFWNSTIANNTSILGNCIFIYPYTLANCETKNNVYHNNFCFKNQMNFIKTSGTAPFKLSNNKFYNNTVLGGEISLYIYGDGDTDLVYFTIKNNIFRGAFKYNIKTRHPTFTNMIFGHNNYDPEILFNFGLYEKDFLQWKSVTGDSNSLTVDPLLINPGGDSPADYRLREKSGCLQKGITIPELTADFHGNGWRTPPSLGAIEYGKMAGAISPKTIGGTKYRPQ